MTYTHVSECDASLYDVKAAARTAARTVAADPDRYGLPFGVPLADLAVADVHDALRDAAYELLDTPEYRGLLDLDDDLIDVTEWAVTAVFSPRSFR